MVSEAITGIHERANEREYSTLFAPIESLSIRVHQFLREIGDGWTFAASQGAVTARRDDDKMVTRKYLE